MTQTSRIHTKASYQRGRAIYINSGNTKYDPTSESDVNKTNRLTALNQSWQKYHRQEKTGYLKRLLTRIIKSTGSWRQRSNWSLDLSLRFVSAFKLHSSVRLHLSNLSTTAFSNKMKFDLFRLCSPPPSPICSREF